MADRDPRLPSRPKRAGYDQDFAAWLLEQAAALKEGRFGDLDPAELADEVEGLARREFKALVRAIRIVLLHMLKWDYQIAKRSRSWRNSIAEHRRQILEELQGNPSFRARLPEAVARAYAPARLKAHAQTEVFLPLFPEDCPYSWDEIMTRRHEFDADTPADER